MMKKRREGKKRVSGGVLEAHAKWGLIQVVLTTRIHVEGKTNRISCSELEYELIYMNIPSLDDILFLCFIGVGFSNVRLSLLLPTYGSSLVRIRIPIFISACSVHVYM